MRTIRSYQVEIEKNVDKLISLAEVQYNALSSVVFSFAGRYTNVLGLKARHDRISYLASAKARELNRFVGDSSAAVIERFEKPKTNREKAEAAAKKAVRTTQSQMTATKKSIKKAVKEW